MKRGLKDAGVREDEVLFDSCRVFPDEEGTERPASAVAQSWRDHSCRVFPDEEGTERSTSFGC